MGYDPFAPAADEKPAPTTDTNPGSREDKPVNNTPAPAVIPAADGKLVVTLKGGAGFDAPWIVIHAADAADALEQLRDESLRDLMQITKSAAAHFSGGSSSGGGAPRGNNGGGGQAQRGRPANAGSAPDGEKRYCEHGERVYKTGVASKGRNAGKTWEAYDCPERVCDREWKN